MRLRRSDHTGPGIHRQPVGKEGKEFAYVDADG
ncbi:MAG: hypothetical protein QOI99_791, partial [Actinomycetota bacterium]|nr:hypothetical protein [Actinomycetota bacterium]